MNTDERIELQLKNPPNGRSARTCFLSRISKLHIFILQKVMYVGVFYFFLYITYNYQPLERSAFKLRIYKNYFRCITRAFSTSSASVIS